MIPARSSRAGLLYPLIIVSHFFSFSLPISSLNPYYFTITAIIYCFAVHAKQRLRHRNARIIAAPSAATIRLPGYII